MDVRRHAPQARRMAWVRGWLVGSVVLGGCGPVLGTPAADGSSDASAGETGSDVEDTGSADEAPTTIPGDDSDGSDDSDSDDSADTTGATESGLCGADSPNGPLAVLADSDSAAILLADGQAIALEVPPEPFGQAFATGADAVGDHIVLSTGVGGLVDGEFQYSGALSLFDRDGGLVWRVPSPDYQMNSPHLAADGSVVVTRSDLDGAADAAVFVDGGLVRTTLGFYPMGPASAGGDVPGTIGDDSRPGWWVASDDSLLPVASAPLPGSVVRDGDGFIYLAQDGLALTLVHEQVDGRDTVSLPALIDIPNLRIEPGATTSWMVVSTSDPRTGEPSNWWRIDVATGTTTAFDLTPPDDRMPLDCYWPLAMLDAQGRVYRGVRDASSAQLFRLDVDTLAWDPIGLELTTVDAINAAAYGDTLLLRADEAGQTFCPLQTYEPDRDALAGASVQLLYPAAPEPLVVSPLLWPTIRRDGECATLLGIDDEGAPRGELMDLRSGARLDLPGDTVAQGNVLAWWRP